MPLDSQPMEERPGDSTDTNSTSTQSECIRVVPLSLEFIPFYWDLVAPMIQRAVLEAAEELTLGDVKERLLAQTMQLLVAVEGSTILAAFVTEVVNYPRKRSLRIVFAGGSGARKWRTELQKVLRIGARNIGATSIETFCRGGFKKILDKFPDVKVKYYVLVEDL